MDDLISRQAAIDAIWDGTNMDIYTREVKEILEKLPAAEPRKGKWVKKWRNALNGYTHISGYKCTECNALYPWQTNYCPNCGAKMEESE